MKREHGYTDAEDILFFLAFFGIIGTLAFVGVSALLAIDTTDTAFAINTKKNTVSQTEWKEDCHFTLSFDKCEPWAVTSNVEYEYDTSDGSISGVPTEIVGNVEMSEDMPRGVYAMTELVDGNWHG